MKKSFIKSLVFCIGGFVFCSVVVSKKAPEHLPFAIITPFVIIAIATSIMVIAHTRGKRKRKIDVPLNQFLADNLPRYF